MINQSCLIGFASAPSLAGVDSAVVAAELEGPPGFVRLAAHPLRWRLLRELIQSDRAVRELTERVDKPQNLVSYHLRQLRDGGLVHARRSTADGRDTLLRDRPRLLRAAAAGDR